MKKRLVYDVNLFLLRNLFKMAVTKIQSLDKE